MNDVFNLPANPFDSDSQVPEVQEAITLHDAARKASEVVGTAHAGIREARDAITAAQHALDVAIQESAEAGRPHKDEVKLARAIKDAQDAADPQIHNRRVAIAVSAQRAAVSRFHAYVAANLPVLLDSFRQEAHDSAEAVAGALAKIAPVRQRRGEIAGRISSLISIGRATPTTHGITLSVDQAAAWQLAEEESAAPLPSDSAVSFYYPEVAPEPVPEVELASSDGTRSGW